jgi:hypothetical protein
VVAPARAQRLEAGEAVVGGERDVEQVAKLPVEVAGAALRVFEGPDGKVA